MKTKAFKLSAVVLAVALMALLGLAACTGASTTTTSTAVLTTTSSSSPILTTSSPTSSTTGTAITPGTSPTTSSSTTTMPPTTSFTYAVNIGHSTALGDYLVDGKGMTLYYFAKDSPGVSSASAAVIANWPVFYAANIVVPAALKAADFGSITRSDGTPQTTYKGYPLYYYIGDKAPGDTNGQGLGGVWFVVSLVNFPPTSTSTTSTVSTTPSTTSTTSTPTSGY